MKARLSLVAAWVGRLAGLLKQDMAKSVNLARTKSRCGPSFSAPKVKSPFEARQSPSVPKFIGLSNEGVCQPRRETLEGRLAVPGYKRIYVDQGRQAIRRVFGHGSNDHPSVAVSDEDNVSQILELEYAHHILDMRLQSDFGPKFVSPNARA